MHELLAPLLYVLHVDLERLGQVRKEHEDHFTDKFDDLSFHENDATYNFDFKKFLDSMEDEIGSHGNSAKVRSLDELDDDIQTIILLSDAYGAEGELGIVLSEKFMEHDAYCMFDALMSGHGAVAMADFFAPPSVVDVTNLPPVIEASNALYHLLSVVDSSLHSHLVELGVEPQYFALRWLRVLFGREFSIENLLLVWDEIFASDNVKLNNAGDNDEDSSFGILSSPRGALIASIAVAMMLYLRSSLLATEHATSCLQRLLNFPEKVNIQKIIGKAKSLEALALDSNISSFSSSYGGAYSRSKSAVVRGTCDSIPPKTPLTVVPDSYWEEKWQRMRKAEELRQNSLGKESPSRRKGWSEKVRLTLSRTESDPSPAKVGRRIEPRSRTTARRSLLKDLSRELGLEEDVENSGDCEASNQEGRPSVEEEEKQDIACKDITQSSEERCLNGNAGSEENSSIFSDPASPVSGANDHDNDSEKSSVASNTSLDENDGDQPPIPEDRPLPVSHPHDDVSQNSPSPCNNDSTVKSATGQKERKLHFGKFQWIWKFGRNVTAGEETSEKGVSGLETDETASACGDQMHTAVCSTTQSSYESLPSNKGDVLDQNMMGTLKNLGQSMLEHIQVSFFHRYLLKFNSFIFSISICIFKCKFSSSYRTAFSLGSHIMCGSSFHIRKTKTLYSTDRKQCFGSLKTARFSWLDPFPSNENKKSVTVLGQVTDVMFKVDLE